MAPALLNEGHSPWRPATASRLGAPCLLGKMGVTVPTLLSALMARIVPCHRVSKPFFVVSFSTASHSLCLMAGRPVPTVFPSCSGSYLLREATGCSEEPPAPWWILAEQRLCLCLLLGAAVQQRSEWLNGLLVRFAGLRPMTPSLPLLRVVNFG